MSGPNLNSLSSAVVSARRRLTKDRDPFTRKVGKPLLVHCSHHKVATVWFKRVLEAVAANYELAFEAQGPDRPSKDTELLFFNNAFRFKHEYVDGRNFRGSHIVRDPRDLVVSAYHYHLRTSEEWVTAPNDEWGGKSYQEHLQSLDAKDGLFVEIARCARSEIASMSTWDYYQPEFIELRYEDALRDEESMFRSLFRHYGFRWSEVLVSAEIARRYSLEIVRSYEDGHVRSGQPGEWRASFGPEHVAYFKELTGDLVVRLGYESNMDW